MSEIVTFSDEKIFRRKVHEVLKKHRSLIESKLPYAEIIHVGSTAVEGSLTKGDVDLQVRVPQSDFSQAKERLREMYDVNEGSSQTSYFCAFEDPDEILPLGVQLTVTSSDVDHFWLLTKFFRVHPDYLKEYNKLKEKHNGKNIDKYREEKGRFIEEIFASDSYQEFINRFGVTNNWSKGDILPFPAATSRDEKMEMIDEITDRLFKKYEGNILAIGVYGSVGAGSDGPYSDIEMHVITRDGFSIEGYEFIYDKFKIEISTEQKSTFFKKAMEVDESWAITAGVYINIHAIFDPGNIFEEVKGYPFKVSDEAMKEVMREFMIWEPYETIGKIRNSFKNENLNYIPLGAKDLAWQTAKLIGLANRQIYSTRARTFEESLAMSSKPQGYDELVKKVMEGKLDSKEQIYSLCENLWVGLNNWYKELGIEYRSEQLPF
ncbi:MULTISPECIES: kanamycin nucleotidyltransferase C-terminal domain-containing protein [Bacillaceae]|uniref:GrpB family protein n=1 Tax=Evansella alkalicola TaxID=745819 RepID=A0ABS6JWX8_9BACI|nr:MULTISPECIES: kanamycin nucleotidyltransferase C-terminal domain-containing protein [Bacillaceae]MBU9722737.1 GrpB family protein [Bacillus alkalicola]